MTTCPSALKRPTALSGAGASVFWRLLAPSSTAFATTSEGFAISLFLVGFGGLGVLRGWTAADR
jgi:hypothetical protein